MSNKLIFAVLIVGAMSLLVNLGCNQITDANVKQAPSQPFVQPAAQSNDQATRGSQVNINNYNAPDRAAPGTTSSLGRVLPASATTQPAVNTAVDTAFGLKSGAAGIDKTSGAFIQNVYITGITIGNTTPTQSGSQTPNITGTQTATASPVAYPVQDVKPELTTSIPIAVAMPGGVNDQQATATGKGTTSDVAKTSDNDVTNTQIKAVSDKLAEVLDVLSQLVAKINATSQPAK